MTICSYQTSLHNSGALDSGDLDLRFRFINKLEGIKKLKKHPSSIDLSCNNINIIEDIDAFRSLKYLSISSNQLTKISGLSKLASISHLVLNDNRISDLSGLENLRNLSVLNVERNLITEIYGLDRHIKLRELYLGYNKISKVQGLQGLRQLEALGLNNNRISSIDPIDLKDLVSLKDLQLSGNELASASFLKGIPGKLEVCRSSNTITALVMPKELESISMP